MRRFILATALFFCCTLISVGTALGQYDGGTMYPTLPGTGVRDFSQPGLKFEPDSFGGGTTIRRTLPGTSVPDHSQPGMRIEQDFMGRTQMYETLPGTNVRDFSKPGFVFD